MITFDNPYRGTVIVIPDVPAPRRATYGDIPVIVILVLNCFVAGVLLSCR